MLLKESVLPATLETGKKPVMHKVCGAIYGMKKYSPEQLMTHFREARLGDPEDRGSTHK